MKNILVLISLIIFLGSCDTEPKSIKFIPLNPPFEEFIPLDSPYLEDVFKGKVCRSDYFIIDGFRGRSESFDNKLDSVVINLGNKFKKKYPSYSIHFYKLGGEISINKKYDLHSLKEYQGKKQCISEVVFREGKLYYFVYIDNEMILYDYINKRVMNEIF